MKHAMIASTLVLLWAGAVLAAEPAELFREGKADEARAAYRQRIEQAATPKDKAMLHKELGDLFAGIDNYTEASREYVAALSLSRDFPTAERVRMAVGISWADRLDDAVRELRAVLADEPGNVPARIHLARTLSWQSKLDEAITEANRVLIGEPENRDALLVKANSLRWQGKTEAAIPIYQGLLTGREDFDARIGLAYSLLARGDKKGSQENVALLKPTYAYQKRDLKRLLEEIDNATNHTVAAGYTYYNDTDDNRYDRYGLSYTYQEPGWSVTTQYLLSDNRDPSRNNDVNSLLAGGYARVAGRFGVGAGVGAHVVNNSDTNTIMTWRLNADADVGKGAVGVGVRKELYIDTAELVEKRIRVLALNAYASQRLTDRFSLYGGYTWRDYSDDNNSNDLTISPSYTLYAKNPVVRTGYRFRYLDFDRQSRGGYFDPKNFTSHQLFVSLDWKKDRFSLFLEPYGGYQSFDRNNDHTSDLFGGFTGVLGYRITKGLLAEVNGEFGNYAVGATSGYEYYLVGTRLAYSF
jgi:tetratricopeptide (TPR) repeat protein